jgi:uncharacterized protein (DUF1697 family)
MEALRAVFVKMRFAEVETFIASGNVIFAPDFADRAALERRIERALHASLGLDVPTFVRTSQEVRDLAKVAPFPPRLMREAGSVNVGFLAAPLDAKARAALASLATPIDVIETRGSEVFWLCRKTQSQSTLSNVVIERAIGVRTTFRGIKTVVRLAGKLA